MNGYTNDPGVFERIANLIEQIPQDVRLAIVGECIPWDGNPHTFESELTGYCLRKAWQATAWLAEAKADAQEFRDVKFGSKQWFDDLEEIPF